MGDLCGSGNVVQEGGVQNLFLQLYVDGSAYKSNPVKYQVNSTIETMKGDIAKKVGVPANSLLFTVNGKDIKSWTGSISNRLSDFDEKLEVKKIACCGPSVALDKEILSKRKNNIWEFDLSLFTDKIGKTLEEWGQIKSTCVQKNAESFKGEIGDGEGHKENVLFTMFIIHFLKTNYKNKIADFKMPFMQTTTGLKKIATKYDDNMQKAFEGLVPLA